MAGHTIREQICQVVAQVKHIKDYRRDHGPVFEENVKQYKSMNTTKGINRAMIEDTMILITNMEELIYATEDLQSSYHKAETNYYYHQVIRHHHLTINHHHNSIIIHQKYQIIIIITT